MQEPAVGLEHPRNIRIKNDEHDTLCGCRNAAELQPGVQPIAVAREFRWDDRALLEARTDHAQASGWRRNKQADQQAGDHQ